VTPRRYSAVCGARHVTGAVTGTGALASRVRPARQRTTRDARRHKRGRSHGIPVQHDDEIAALVALVALINAANRLGVIVDQKGGSYEPGMFASLTS
jgi:hypothetical protein